MRPFRRGLLLPAAAAVVVTAAGVAAWLLIWQPGSPGQERLAAAPEAAQAPAPTPEPTPAAPPLGYPPYRMTIEKLGVDAPVSTFGLDENDIPRVPLGPEAGQVVAWYDFSALPGTGSNAVFAGHVTWNGPAVFFDLQSLQAGDTVRLRGKNGVEAVYRVSKNLTVDANDTDALQLMFATDTDVVTLITCGGTYIPNASAATGGDYTQRIIVQADLVSVTPQAAGQPRPNSSG